MAGNARRTELLAYIESRHWSHVGTPEWLQLRARFPQLSETTIRNALAARGACICQPYAGIGTKSLDELESSLVAMAYAYTGSPEQSKLCRQQVIAAKDRTRFASRNPKTSAEKRALKAEMVEWMLVWLGDPAMFATWTALRKRTHAANPLT